MKKSFYLLFVFLLLTSCSTGEAGLQGPTGAEDNQFPSNVSVYYSKYPTSEEGGGTQEYYMNGEKFFEYLDDESAVAAFVATNEGYAIQYFPDSYSGSLYDTEDPSKNVISLQAGSGLYQTFYSYGWNNQKMELFNGIPVYEYCLEAQYNEEARRNECKKSNLMYGDELLAEIEGVIYFDGLWDGVFVYNDHSGNVYSVDLNSEQKEIRQISSAENGYGFSFMKEGNPIFSDYIFMDQACDGLDLLEEYLTAEGSQPLRDCSAPVRNLIFPEEIKENVEGEAISRGEIYMLKKDPLNYMISSSDWLGFVLMRGDVKVASVKLPISHMLEVNLVDSSTHLCSFEISNLTIYTENDPCVYGQSSFWLQDEEYLGGTSIFMNGSPVELPEGWYLPSFEDQYDFESYNPYYDTTACFESQNCLIVEHISPVFGEGNSFGLMVVAYTLSGPRTLFYLEYENGVFARVTTLEEGVTEFYGVIQ